jgi:hypothetical protein
MVMVGAPAVVAWIAQLAFWVLLALGLFYGELSRRSMVTFVVLWMAGYFGLPRLFESGGHLVPPYIALLDIALVWIVFKGDIRLT